MRREGWNILLPVSFIILERDMAMQYDKHGNGNGLDDLYLLPESEEEKEMVVDYLKKNGLYYSIEFADGADKDSTWHRKFFILVPFAEGERKEIKNMLRRIET
jgi:hypothetical protein